MGLPAVLGRRAPQYSRSRQRGDFGGVGERGGGDAVVPGRVGGIILPNHAALMVAEQFGMLEALHPGRVDLGLGRAPGDDFATIQALRRNLGSSGDTFSADLDELQGYVASTRPRQAVRAIRGEGSIVPIWLLGSSDSNTRLAAAKGLPFAFASHFASDSLFEALGRYRSAFRPSVALDAPYAMVGVNVVAAETDAEAHV